VAGGFAARHYPALQALGLYADNAVIVESFSGVQWVGLDQIRSRYLDLFNRLTFLENTHEFLDLKQDSEDNATVRVRQRAKVTELKS